MENSIGRAFFSEYLFSLGVETGVDSPSASEEEEEELSLFITSVFITNVSLCIVRQKKKMLHLKIMMSQPHFVFLIIYLKKD